MDTSQKRMRRKLGDYCLMVRVKSCVTAHARKKAVLKDAKGQFGHRSKRYQQAKRSVVKGLTYAFRDRKCKKREFRRLWIIRISAACKEEGILYSRFIKGLVDANIEINRKVISELAIHSPEAFRQLVEAAKNAKPQVKAKEAVAA